MNKQQLKELCHWWNNSADARLISFMLVAAVTMVQLPTPTDTASLQTDSIPAHLIVTSHNTVHWCAHIAHVQRHKINAVAKQHHVVPQPSPHCLHAGRSSLSPLGPQDRSVLGSSPSLLAMLHLAFTQTAAGSFCLSGFLIMTQIPS